MTPTFKTKGCKILGKSGLIFLFSIIILPYSSKACDLCGCVSTGGQIGVLQQFDRNFIGMRFQFHSFLHQNVSEAFMGNDRVKEDEFFLPEIWSRIQLSDRMQLLLSLPYSYKVRLTEGDALTNSGLGDMSALLNTVLFRKETEKLSYQWNAGLGLRLPTGKYRQRDDRKVLLPIGMQSGTGAYAFPIFTQLGIRKSSWGILAEGLAQFHSLNEDDYQLGNYYQASLNLLYYHQGLKSLCIPHIGMRYEKSNADREYGFEQKSTGSSKWVAAAGFDYYWSDWSIGARFSIPLYLNAQGNQPLWQGNAGIQLIRFLGGKEKEKNPAS